MIRFRSLFTLAALALVTLASTGCIKFQQVLTLMPDGSGKVEMTVGMSEMMIAMSGEDPFADFTIETVSQDTQGIVAFSEPEVYEADGYKFATVTAYFEDINEVSLESMESDIDFEYTPEGDGFKLVVNPSPIRSMAQQMVQQLDPAQLEDPQAQQMLEGFEFSEAYRLPGAISEASGLEADGQTLSLQITGEHILNNSVPANYGESAQIEITFGPSTLANEEIVAFQAELEDAKETYEQLLEEAGLGETEDSM